MRAALAALALAPALALAASPALALSEDDTPLTACDILAGHPSDPGNITEGVSSTAADVDRAIPACERAVEQYPDSPRQRYQLGRVMFYKFQRMGGDDMEMAQSATGHVQAAADMDWTQAKFVRGLLAMGMGETCTAAPLFKSAADDGLKAARMQVAKDVMAGAYADCDIEVSMDEVGAYLEANADEMEGYYESMLHGVLTAQYEAMAAE